MTDWEKRALELYPEALTHPHGWIPPIAARAKALQLGREMADERAEEIAKMLDSEDCSDCKNSARIARSTIAKPKTREQMLEAALREISQFGPELRGAATCAEIARRALEAK